jgi:hypothetical protein
MPSADVGGDVRRNRALKTVGAVVDPTARNGDPLTRRNTCGVANDGHDVTMTPRPCAQNAKTILGIMIGDALDETRQYLFYRSFWLPAHTNVRARGTPFNVS